MPFSLNSNTTHAGRCACVPRKAKNQKRAAWQLAGMRLTCNAYAVSGHDGGNAGIAARQRRKFVE